MDLSRVQPGELVYMVGWNGTKWHEVKVSKVTGKYVFVERLDGGKLGGLQHKKFVKETGAEWVSHRSPSWHLETSPPKRE